MKRTVLVVGLFLTPLACWAAYNEPVPGNLTQSNLGSNVFAALQTAVGVAGSFVVNGGALGTPSTGNLANVTGCAVSTCLSGTGNGIPAALGVPPDAGVSTPALVSFAGLAADVYSVTSMAATVQAAIKNAVNGALGLVQINASGYIPVLAQVGVSDGSVAAAGNIGEVISSDVVVGSAISVTTGTPKTITSVALTAGDWTCQGSIATNPAGTTTTSYIQSGLNTVTNVLPLGEKTMVLQSAIAAGLGEAWPIPSQIINVGAPTTIYLVTQANFAVSTMTIYGQMFCRRER